MFRSMEVKPNDVFEFLRKTRIVGNLEGPDQMRFEPMLLPNATHRAWTDIQSFAHGGKGPMGGVGRFLPRRHPHHQSPQLRRITWFASTPRSIGLNARASRLHKARPPAPGFVP